MCEQLFDPASPEERDKLEKRMIEALENCPGHTLPPQTSFRGVGVYTLYYHGNFALYSALAKRNTGGHFMVPIYAGKANLKGSRTARSSTTRQAPLYNRLREHAESIEQTQNLSLEDFKCKYLVLNQIWVTLGEQVLIRKYSPLWNTVIEGFGIHHPGSGRARQQRSQWDTLHPGRKWVKSLKLPSNVMSVGKIRQRVRAYFDQLT
jgi:hypothetical protein